MRCGSYYYFITQFLSLCDVFNFVVFDYGSGLKGQESNMYISHLTTIQLK